MRTLWLSDKVPTLKKGTYTKGNPFFFDVKNIDRTFTTVYASDPKIIKFYKTLNGVELIEVKRGGKPKAKAKGGQPTLQHGTGSVSDDDEPTLQGNESKK